MNKHIKVIILLILFMFIFSSCNAGFNSAYIRTDYNTYEAIAPEYLEYVSQDEKLSDFEKNIRRRTVQTWRDRIIAARESLQNEE